MLLIMYSVFDIANYILQQYEAKNLKINNLKLQKILYYIQINALQKHDQPLFQEPIEMWWGGGNVPKLYFELQKYVCTPIHPDDSCFTDAKPINDFDKEIIQEIIDKTLDKKDLELVTSIQATQLYKDYFVTGVRHPINHRDLKNGEINI